jgi:spore coat polysaccharide biosynthesis protein SpsF
MDKTKTSKVVAIVEARMGSSRLPGKVLADIQGKPALMRLISRLRFCKELDEIVVATSTSPKDDSLAEWLQNNSVKFYRGSEEDVLQRVVDACNSVHGDIIVEVTGDCILTDYELIDQAILSFYANDCDVVSNCGVHKTFPMGAYAQVFRSKDLEWVANNIMDDAVREHVSLYFYENLTTYKIINLIAPQALNHPEWRLQLDYQEDLDFLNAVYKKLEPTYGENFTLNEIGKLLLAEPELLSINKHCIENTPRP